ncbi:hypothetical protein EVAR_24237_1 [Eumeta japonica]|uniref:Uncharacterized protein n=1 Tax=Eumeta variegata TaxID=151549 RepID=A0A4C1W4V6_EUMVA|nr:hypothetical protein EVAR_24237_1 [Eumeta japonica]
MRTNAANQWSVYFYLGRERPGRAGRGRAGQTHFRMITFPQDLSVSVCAVPSAGRIGGRSVACGARPSAARGRRVCRLSVTDVVTELAAGARRHEAIREIRLHQDVSGAAHYRD